jgi:serine/threonine-protein kinase
MQNQMPLAVGTRLGPYLIEELLGAGGMGEVYRAQDTRLGRAVAIKLLTESFTRDTHRLTRLRREAKLLASLSHPNIASIYELEETEDGLVYLVLEFVPGEALSRRLKAGPLPFDEAIELCKHVAGALEAAHEKGIVHRDLKPANIMVSPEGIPKVLDFGVAKATGPASETETTGESTATMDGDATEPGTVLGTPSYMSPEQARGKAIDKRTDIWAFGCLLYETISGRRAFTGETSTDTLAHILRGHPDWQALPSDCPPAIQRLVRRCLEKKRADRLRDIGDARMELEEFQSSPSDAEPLTAPAPRPVNAVFKLGRLALVLAVAFAAGAAAMFLTTLLTDRPVPPPLSRFAIDPPSGGALAPNERPSVAISPDGSRIVYLAVRGGNRQLYLRTLDRLEATPLAGTEDGYSPFFSPDGRWVGFFAGGMLKKVSVSGGPPVTICLATNSFGASWGPDDRILFTPLFISSVWQVSSGGGKPQPLTTLDVKAGERTHHWPQILPGGKYAIMSVWSGGSWDDAAISLIDLSSGEHRLLLAGGSLPRYSTTGHIVFARSNSLFAVPFDLKTLKIGGPPAPVLEGVLFYPTSGAAHYDLSTNGSLVYLPGGSQQGDNRLMWVDRQGKSTPLHAPTQAYAYPRLSPDGRKIAVQISAATGDIWVFNLDRDALSRFTSAGNNEAPVWTPDGKRIVFSSNTTGRPNLYWKPADGSAAPQRLGNSEWAQFPSSWTPDGRTLFFHEFRGQDTREDILLMNFQGIAPAGTRPFLQSSFSEAAATIAPSGQWLAYVSDETGRKEIYVQAYPGPGEKRQVSSQGGSEPVWARSGQELFYRERGRIVSVTIQAQPTLTTGKPRVLMEDEFQPSEDYLPNPNYDVSLDGRSFLMIKKTESSKPAHVNLFMNWSGEMREKK